MSLHDATKVQLGTTQSSFRVVDSAKGEIEAGKIVRLDDDGTLSIAEADGAAIGISLGKDLGGAGLTSICRAGLRVPVLLTAGFNPTIGTQVAIDDVTGVAKAAGEGVTGVNAVFATGRLAGGAVSEDGTANTLGVALIDFPGGL